MGLPCGGGDCAFMFFGCIPMTLNPVELVCARCDYPLRGVGADGVCPECGLGVVVTVVASRGQRRWSMLHAVMFIVLALCAMVRNGFLLAIAFSDEFVAEYGNGMSTAQVLIHFFLLLAMFETGPHKSKFWQWLGVVAWVMMSLLGTMLLVMNSVRGVSFVLFISLCAGYGLVSAGLWFGGLVGLRRTLLRVHFSWAARLLAVAAMMSLAWPLVVGGTIATLLGLGWFVRADNPGRFLAFGLVGYDVITCCFIAAGACAGVWGVWREGEKL